MFCVEDRRIRILSKKKISIGSVHRPCTVIIYLMVQGRFLARTGFYDFPSNLKSMSNVLCKF